MRRYALLTRCGTACPETVLFGGEDTPEWRAAIEETYCKGGQDDPVPGTWTNVTENEACDPAKEAL